MWKPGPLPENTYNWGGCTPKDMTGSGFYFADFCGDKVKLMGCSRAQIEEILKDENLSCKEKCDKLCDVMYCGQVIKAEDVAFYNNSLELPPCCSTESKRL